MEFDWHIAKSERNRAERGFGFDAAALIFEGPVLEFLDSRRDYGETRIKALGLVDGVLLSVVYTDRENVRWIISARRASRKERRVWDAR
ncbi:BrnT family toxin [Enterovirga sp. CN4-39]|uniref:BrnT family toxin n=1 Tax=Enterovirga sp. CN4-39 TaxID=3400910 RepID=UPI003C0BB8DE